MSLQVSLPFGKSDSLKDLVFTLLSKEYPLRIIDLTNFIRKRYGKSVTFQAVRKAVLELTEEKVLLKAENRFLVNKEWVLNTKGYLDELYSELTRERKSAKDVSLVGENISVFSFNSLNEMMKFWQNLMDNWFEKFKKGDENINCYQAAHAWEGLLHIDKERELMSKLKKKGIASYIISVGNTPLDKNIKKFYRGIGIKMSIDHTSSSFDKGYYVGTYGDLVVQSQYPKEIVEQLDKFFRKNKSLDNLNLAELSEIVNKKIEMKLTVIKNLAMAKQINKSILPHVD